MRLKHKLAKTSAIAALMAIGLFASSTNAFADEVCANFTTAQSDWYSGNNTSFGSWPLGSPWTPTSIYIKFQSDGNLVIHRQQDGAVMWASGTWGHGVTDLDWSQSAGGILLRHSNGSIACQIGSGASGGHAQVQEDGNFVFYAPDGHPTWASGTENGQQTRDACPGF
ncbi:hypothetical protein [Kitasatospora sp. MAP12-22]